METMGERIAKSRRNSNLKVSELARLCEVTAQTLHSLEKGASLNPGIAIIQSISQQLNVSIDWIVNGKIKNSSSETVAEKSNAASRKRDQLIEDMEAQAELMKTQIQELKKDKDFLQSLLLKPGMNTSV